MKVLTILASLMIALAWLWGVYHLVRTPMELAIFVISVVVFAILWFWVIKLEYASNTQADIWKKRIGSVASVLQIAYIIVRIVDVKSYEIPVLIILATSFFGISVYWGFRLVKDKVFD